MAGPFISNILCWKLQVGILKWILKTTELESQASQTMALLPLLSKILISTTNKLFRSESFWVADFVYIREQEILPRKKLWIFFVNFTNTLHISVFVNFLLPKKKKKRKAQKDAFINFVKKTTYKISLKLIITSFFLIVWKFKLIRCIFCK